MLSLHRRYTPGGGRRQTGPVLGTPETVRLNLERLVPAMHFIAQHFREHIEIEELAKMCFMGVGNFRRVFGATFGTNPKRYITNMRIARACIDLRSSPQFIDAIAFQNGFTDISSFNREFKRQLGKTPRQWRKSAE
jgi:AraC-like DNA-binding protein